MFAQHPTVLELYAAARLNEDLTPRRTRPRRARTAPRRPRRVFALLGLVRARSQRPAHAG